MRHLILILTLVLTTGSLYAQDQKIITKEDNNTFKVVYLNEDSNIMQQGFIKNNKLHGKWSRTPFQMDSNRDLVQSIQNIP